MYIAGSQTFRHSFLCDTIKRTRDSDPLCYVFGSAIQTYAGIVKTVSRASFATGKRRASLFPPSKAAAVPIGQAAPVEVNRHI